MGTQSLSHLASAFQPLPTFAIVLVLELKLERGDIVRAPGIIAGYLAWVEGLFDASSREKAIIKSPV